MEQVSKLRIALDLRRRTVLRPPLFRQSLPVRAARPIQLQHNREAAGVRPARLAE